MWNGPGESAALGQRALTLLRDLINQRCGIQYEDDRLDLLAGKLEGRVVDLGLASFEEYYHYLRYDPGGGVEWQALADAVTVNETYFMREVDQLQAFVETVVPGLRATKRSSRLTIWSAACSTGEEPYSLAMLLLEHGLADNVGIIATDISRKALDQARRGAYGRRSLRAMPPHLAEKYLDQDTTGWKIQSRVREMVSLGQMNLLDRDAMRLVRGMDAIFCRNAFIYFDQASVQQVVDGFYSVLNPGGYLFVGAAESLIRVSTRFELVEVGNAFGYRKS